MSRFRDVAVPGFALALLGLALGVATLVLPILGIIRTKLEAEVGLGLAVGMFAVGVVILVLWVAALRKRKERPLVAIKADLIQTSDDIHGFLATVSNLDPIHDDQRSDFKQFTERLLRHSSTTMQEYSRRFGGRVQALQDRSPYSGNDNFRFRAFAGATAQTKLSRAARAWWM